MGTESGKYAAGRLTARPGKFSEKTKAETGVQPLALDQQKDSVMYIPAGYDSSRPAALAVMLHGAGAPAGQGLALLREYADKNNIILLAPASRSRSWDIIAQSAFGPDVSFIDQALTHVFETYAIDPAHVAIGGFSDGASYALSIGLTNGDLFTHIIAFSPGFAHTLKRYGEPAIFVSHGVHDTVLPIDPCSRRFTPQLQRQGLAVKYIEFDGGHAIPENIAESAVQWFVA